MEQSRLQQLMQPLFLRIRNEIGPLCCDGCKQEYSALEKAYNGLNLPYYEVGIVGLQGSGKSTLVNALVGREVVYASARVATHHTVHLTYGQEEKVLLKLRDGSVEERGIDCLRHPIDLDADVEIHACVNSPLLQKGVVLVDTPGLESAIQTEEDTMVVERYLQSAYSLIVVCHATRPGISGFSELLRKLHEQKKDILVVVTAADLLDEEELEEATAVVAEQVETIVPGASIYAISALQALGELDSIPALQLQFDRLINHLVEQAARFRISRAFAFLDRCLQFCHAAKRIIVDNREQKETELRTLSKALEEESRSVSARLEPVSQIEQFLLESLENLLEQAEGRWNTSRQEIFSRAGWYIANKDISTLNNTFSDKFLSFLSNHLVNTLQFVEKGLIQIHKQVQEITNGLHYSCFVPPPATGAFELDKSWTDIQRVDEGFFAWLFDPDDTKRKSQLRQSVQQKLDTISKHLMEHLLSQINTSRALWNSKLSEIKEEISAQERALSAAVADRKRQLEQIAQDVKRLEVFLKQLRSVAVQYRLVLLFDYLLFGYYTGSPSEAQSGGTLREVAWVKEQLQRMGLRGSLEVVVRSLLKKRQLIELLKVMLVSFVLVAHWNHLISDQFQDILTKYSIVDEELSEGLRNLMVFLRWYALSTDTQVHWRTAAEEIKKHPNVERAIVARLYSMAQLSEEEHRYIQRAYGHVEPIFSLRDMLRQAVSESVTRAEESALTYLPTLRTDTPPVSPVRETQG